PETTAITVPWPRNEHSAIAGVKTTSYAENVVALAEARKVGATEAIMGNTAGNLCEGTGTNVFVALDGRLLTPPLMSGCLAGVTRELLLELLPEADEEDVPLAALAEADEVLLTSTTRDVQPLRALDGRPLPGVDGPWARRAMAAVAELQARGPDPRAPPPPRGQGGRGGPTATTARVRRPPARVWTTRWPPAVPSAAAPSTSSAPRSPRTRRPSVAERARQSSSRSAGPSATRAP